MPRHNLHIILLAAALSLVCYQRAARSRYAAVFADAMQAVRSQYVEEVDERQLFNAAMDGMTGELDPYSAYINPEAYQQFQVSIDQNFGGVGIEVSIDPETKRLTIVTPLVGTPAYQAGAQAGDTILAIDGESTEGWRLQDAVGVLRGKPGTPVSMTVLHEGGTEPVDLTMRRANIEIESVMGDTRRDDGQWKFFLQEHPQVGYIRLVNFGEQTVGELKKVLTSESHPVEGWIIDLRGNPGGLLDVAVDVCDMFIDKGDVVSTRTRGGKIERKYRASDDGTIIPPRMPVAILVDQSSASASEIVAACLQDHQRAVVIGERTWGKGTVQNIIDLEGGRSALKLTTATYWRPSGKNIHRLSEDRDEDGEWGVRPNPGFEVEMDEEQLTKLYRWRRERDIVHNGNSGGDQADEDDEPEEEDDRRPDPVVQRAVEYIQDNTDGGSGS